jgi:hypothetical protein
MVTRTRKGTPSFPANTNGASAFQAEQARTDRRKSWGDVKRYRNCRRHRVLISLFAAGFSPLCLAPLSSSWLENGFRREPRNRFFGVVNHFSKMGELASKSRSQVGEHPVELFRIFDADGPGREVANAFLKRGEGHGPSTMPQCATLFDTVHTLDPPKSSSSRMHCDVDCGESGAPPWLAVCHSCTI